MTSAPATAQELTPDEARAIAKEATIYGFPLVDSYRVQYSYFVDRGGREFKGPWNILSNVARVFTPADTAIQTPNSDTPYSALGADLRAEPLVISVPAIEKQLIREGADPVGGTSEEFGQFVQREYEKWKLIVIEAGARAD